MAGALDGLSQGVVLADDRGVVLHANRAGEAMLKAGAPLEIAEGVLRAASHAADGELSRALSLAGRDAASIGSTGTTIRLTGPETPPVFAHVLPVMGGRRLPGTRSGAAAAIFIDTATDCRGGADALAAAHGLTEAERRVLASLVAGRTLFETADDPGIARTTVRTHLSRIFAKTCVSRQTDLVRLTLQAAPGSYKPARP